MTRAVTFLFLCLLCSCQSNPFLTNYSGEKFEPIEQASERPNNTTPSRSREIGKAHFISSSAQGSAEAVAAAAKVGADSVWWSKEYKNTTTGVGAIPWTTPATATVTGSYGTSTVYYQRTTYIPYSYTHHWFEYKARFFRSYALDQPKAEPKPLPPKM
jgi:hypothetical protein